MYVPLSPEERARPPVLRVALLQPCVELGVVLLALFASVAKRVVAQIQQSATLRRAIRAGAMRRVPAEDREVPGRELQQDSVRRVDRRIGQLVVLTVASRQAALAVIAAENLRGAVRAVGCVDGDDHGEKRPRKGGP